MTDDAKDPTFKSDEQNANRGTERAHPVIARSLRERGAGRSGLAAKDGTMIAGNQTLEEIQTLGIPIKAVHTTGEEWIVVVRDDIEPGSDEATLLGLEDNRSSEVGMNLDPEVLSNLQDSLDLSGLWSEKELALLLDGQADTAEQEETLFEQAIQLVPQREYIVIVCDDESDFEQLKEALALQQVRRGGYKKSSQFDAIGTQRVVRAKALLARLGVNHAARHTE